jgi:hypothetical protein
VAIPCSWPKPPEQIVTAKVNRSAYLIDGGLWRACKESREVIAKYTHFEDWVRIQKRSIDDLKYYLKYNRSGGNESPHPAFINTCEGEEECRMLVYPTNDIFCLQLSNCIDLKELGFYPDIHMPLNLYKRNDRENDDENDDENGYRWPIYQRLNLKNVAFEFDSSWLVDLPDSKYELLDEKSARGYLASLLDQRAYNYRYDCKRGEWIWIVDKEAKWLNIVDEDEHHDNADKHHDTVYRDCDEEYILIHEYDFPKRVLCGRAGTSADTFLMKIGSMGIGDYYHDWGTNEIYSPYGPEPIKMVMILVRQDNEVKEVKRRCKPKCYRHGWCICSDDEGGWREDEDEDKDVELSKNEA